MREMESVLRLNSGQVAVLGGLMQDNRRFDTDGVPVLSGLDRIGNAFRFRKSSFVKTELVIFIRPRVIRTPSVGEDLQSVPAFPSGEHRGRAAGSALRGSVRLSGVAAVNPVDGFPAPTRRRDGSMAGG